MSRENELSLDNFEWDEKKNLSNIEKHGIRFADAIEVFADPGAITITSRGDHKEPRFLTIGRIGNIVIAVVFTRRAERVRIIFARRARVQERKLYGD